MPTNITSPEIDLIASELANTQAKTQTLRRNGKIARLPKPVRDMLNRMLDDGLPYHVIIDELGDAGRGLNAQNITNWVKGGYQEHLKHLDALDHAKALVQTVVELLGQTGEADLDLIRRASNQVAALQLFEAIRDHGDQALKNMFQQNPAKYIPIIHTLCHMSDSTLKVEKHHLQQELLAARAQLAAPSSQIKVNQAPAKSPAELQLSALPQPSAPVSPSASVSSPIQGESSPSKNPAELQLGRPTDARQSGGESRPSLCPRAQRPSRSIGSESVTRPSCAELSLGRAS